MVGGMAQEDRMLRRVALDQMFQEYKGLQNETRRVEERKEKPRRRRRGRKWLRRLIQDLGRHLDPETASPRRSLLRCLKAARHAVRKLARRLEKGRGVPSKTLRKLLKPVQVLVTLYRAPSLEPDLKRGAQPCPTTPEENREAERVFSLAAALELGADTDELAEARALWSEGSALLETTSSPPARARP